MEPTPQVITSPTALPVSSNWRDKLPVAGIGLLIMVILAELIWGFRLLNSPTSFSPTSQASQIVESVQPQLVAFTPKKQYELGENVPITIKVVTAGNPADGVDVILRYNPEKLEASNQNSFFTLGKIFPEYPVTEVDTKRGIIQISATSPLNSPGFAGVGNLVTLNFKAKALGDTKVTFDFEKNSTAETNLVFANTNRDMLETIHDATFTIGNSSISESAEAINSCSGFFQYCLIGDKSGKQFCQSGKMDNNVCTYDPDLTVSCSECQLQ
jgi:hypothetical protein